MILSRLLQVGGAGLAQLDNPENGPSFGADSLVIPLGKEKPRLARSKLGSYYERFPDGTNSLFGKGNSAVQLKDLKVYHGVYAEGEFIPFTYVSVCVCLIQICVCIVSFLLYCYELTIVYYVLQ